MARWHDMEEVANGAPIITARGNRISVIWVIWHEQRQAWVMVVPGSAYRVLPFDQPIGLAFSERVWLPSWCAQ